jgi:NADH dehydrogenase [ubiquinone] 1 alpha subcomplex assembly factor 7
MTALDEALARRIAREGPIAIDSFMAAALTDPDHGYYTTRDPLGAAGDFTTAPEISQMFGELIGLWHAACWFAAGQPANPVLAELGPGRGTLMADALRAITRACGGAQPFALHLVEASPVLMARQKAALTGHTVTWHASLDDLPADSPLHLIANEFLDALPIRQFVATPSGWRERLLDWRDGGLVPVLAAPESPLPAIAAGLPEGTPVGRVAEIAPAREACTGAIARRIAGHGGAALLIDFTEPRLPLADTLQAVQGHAMVERFADAGLSDLTSAVDFAPLVRLAQAAGAAVHGPVGQGAFLGALGIDLRCAALQRAAGPEGAAAIAAARERLVGRDAMGEDFRVMAILPADQPPPDGFAPQ